MTLPPHEWIAAANMAQRRGEKLVVRRVVSIAYNLELPDGTAIAYRTLAMPRNYRDIDQAMTAIDTYSLDPKSVVLE
jgi:hypothetical protein